MASPAFCRIGRARAAWTIRVNDSQLLLKERPINIASQLRQRMGEIDNPIQTRSEEVSLAALVSLRCPEGADSNGIALPLVGGISKKTTEESHFPANAITC